MMELSRKHSGLNLRPPLHSTEQCAPSFGSDLQRPHLKRKPSHYHPKHSLRPLSPRQSTDLKKKHFHVPKLKGGARNPTFWPIGQSGGRDQGAKRLEFDSGPIKSYRAASAPAITTNSKNKFPPLSHAPKSTKDISKMNSRTRDHFQAHLDVEVSDPRIDAFHIESSSHSKRISSRRHSALSHKQLRRLTAQRTPYRANNHRISAVRATLSNKSRTLLRRYRTSDTDNMATKNLARSHRRSSLSVLSQAPRNNALSPLLCRLESTSSLSSLSANAGHLPLTNKLGKNIPLTQLQFSDNDAEKITPTSTSRSDTNNVFGVHTQQNTSLSPLPSSGKFSNSNKLTQDNKLSHCLKATRDNIRNTSEVVSMQPSPPPPSPSRSTRVRVKELDNEDIHDVRRQKCSPQQQLQQQQILRKEDENSFTNSSRSDSIVRTVSGGSGSVASWTTAAHMPPPHNKGRESRTINPRSTDVVATEYAESEELRVVQERVESMLSRQDTEAFREEEGREDSRRTRIVDSSPKSQREAVARLEARKGREEGGGGGGGGTEDENDAESVDSEKPVLSRAVSKQHFEFKDMDMDVAQAESQDSVVLSKILQRAVKTMKASIVPTCTPHQSQQTDDLSEHKLVTSSLDSNDFVTPSSSLLRAGFDLKPLSVVVNEIPVSCSNLQQRVHDDNPERKSNKKPPLGAVSKPPLPQSSSDDGSSSSSSKSRPNERKSSREITLTRRGRLLPPQPRHSSRSPERRTPRRAGMKSPPSSQQPSPSNRRGGGGEAMTDQSQLDTTIDSTKEEQKQQEESVCESSVELVRVIGTGGYAKVWLGSFKGSDVAVKQLVAPTGNTVHNSLTNKPKSRNNGASKKSPEEVLEREVTILRRFRHKNIVQYIGVFVKHGWSHGTLYNIVMEYVPDGDLDAFLRLNGALLETTASSLTRQVASGLVYLHKHKVIHRDLKPANLLLRKSDTEPGGFIVKISDFGVSANVTGEEAAIQRSCVGTPWYLAPEVARVQPYSYPADIWSLGSVVYAMVTGHKPYNNLAPIPALFKIAREGPPRLPIGDSAPSMLCEKLLTACWKKVPEERLTAKEIVTHEWVTR